MLRLTCALERCARRYMKIHLTKITFQPNPYREWFVLLIFFFAASIAVAAVDARLFLSSAQDVSVEKERLGSPQLDKDQLARAAAAFKEKAKRFEGGK